MIVINIYYSGKDSSARDFANEMLESGLVEEIRAQSGNISYEYFFPMDDPETVLLIDKWTDQQAIDIHHKSEMMPKIAALREKYKLRMKVERYTQL